MGAILPLEVASMSAFGAMVGVYLCGKRGFQVADELDAAILRHDVAFWLLHDLVLRHFGSSLVRALQGRVRPLGMRSSEADEIEARLRKRAEDLDARLARVIAEEERAEGLDARLARVIAKEDERELKDLEAERRKDIAAGKHGRASDITADGHEWLPEEDLLEPLEEVKRMQDEDGQEWFASAAASGSPQPPISDAADDDESGQVERGKRTKTHSSEVDRLDCVANCLFKRHGKDAVIKIINWLRETFASNITPTDLQDMGGEDLVKILVQIAADNDVEAADLLEMCEE